MAKKVTAILLLAHLLLAAPALAGGWVVITLDELPAVRAGEPVTLGFMVRQHGVRPIDGVEVVVSAQHLASGERLEWTAQKGKETGHFIVEALFPQPGAWQWQVTAEPFDQITELPALAVLPAAVAGAPEEAAGMSGVLLRVTGVGLLAMGALLAVVQRRRPGLFLGIGGAVLLLIALVTAPAPAEQVAAAPSTQNVAEAGAALFQSKGCITCHRHEALPAGKSLAMGPDLTNYQPDPAFVRAWLRDPTAVRPGTQMPNLHLDDEEIEALLAFLTESRVAEVAGREACPVTQPPSPAFEPPEGPGDRLREDPLWFWVGSPELWTTLEADGLWTDLPHDQHGYTQKRPFWSEGYNWREEQDPELVLTGRRLDGDAVMTDTGASNAYHPDYGSMIMTGFVLPASGCWEITAEYKDASLSFVVWVDG
ncbi:MAG: c-type cytochrome [Anaerolineae bacterium]|nr:c-type cytochrome [Anaerolineae bacterium]